MAPFEPDKEQPRMFNIPKTVDNQSAFKTVLDTEPLQQVSNNEQGSELNDWNKGCVSNKDENLKLDKQFSSTKFQSSPSLEHIGFPIKSLTHLKSCSVKDLNFIWEELSNVTKRVSSELVQLLLENDALQQESDARNVAIEQLLKLTFNNSEVELRQIQMSIILPDHEDSDSS